MSAIRQNVMRWEPYMLSILRIMISLLFMEHGSQKLFLIPPSQMANSFPLLSLIGISGILEFFGGLLLLVGFAIRPVALILAGEMAVAYFRSHAPQGFWPILNHGELAVLYCFVFLFFMTSGGGSWSLDRLIETKRKERSA